MSAKNRRFGALILGIEMSELQATVLSPRASDGLVMPPTPEFGPLVRAQAIRPRGGTSAVFWVIVGVAWFELTHILLGPFYGPWLTFAVLATIVSLAEFDRDWWRFGRMNLCPSWDGTGPAPSGSAKVRGRVRAIGEPFAVPGGREPVIFAHTLFAQARSDGTRGKFQREDVRGLVLDIELPTELTVRIAPEAVRLVGGELTVPEVGAEVRRLLGAPWAGWLKGRLRRRTLREGDRVEAVGQLVRDVNVHGEASPGRGVPMLHWLTPAWRGGVWIRRIGGG